MWTPLQSYPSNLLLPKYPVVNEEGDDVSNLGTELESCPCYGKPRGPHESVVCVIGHPDRQRK